MATWARRWRRVCDRIRLQFTDSVPEVARLKRNWWIIHLFSFFIGYSWTVTYSSLHQFVTTPKYTGKSDSVRSGLGLGETYYAWIVASFSIGEFFSALAFGVLAKYLKIKTLMLTATVSLLLGSLLYGIGAAGEMLIVGRILQGVHFGGGSALLRIYIGETSNIAVKLKGEDKAKSQIKNTNFFLTFSLATLGVSVGPGSAAIVVQFSSIDQFRWSGWLLVTTCLFELVIIAIYFVELPTDINRKGSQLSLKSLKPAIPIYSIVLLVISFFVINFGFSVIEALINPILADNFGFNLQFISYIFVMTISMFVIANIIIFVLQRVGLTNKAICIIGLMCGVSGCLVTTDWQSLGGDPCDQYSYDKFNSSSYFQDYPYFQEDTHANISWEGLCLSNNTQVCLSMEVCLNHSGPPEECFWNPKSRISGIFCEECEKLCRSWRTSLNFVQLIFGLLLFTLAFPITRISMTVLASDGMGSEGQSLIMGVIVASGSVSKIIGPPAGDALMLLAGRRTYLVMLPMMGMLATVFVGFLVLYRKLSPGTRRSPEEQKWLSEATVETSEFVNSSIVGSEENLESVVEESEL